MGKRARFASDRRSVHAKRAVHVLLSSCSFVVDRVSLYISFPYRGTFLIARHFAPGFYAQTFLHDSLFIVSSSRNIDTSTGFAATILHLVSFYRLGQGEQWTPSDRSQTRRSARDSTGRVVLYIISKSRNPLSVRIIMYIYIIIIP